MLHHVDAGLLRVAFAQSGHAAGWPVVLLHGFPYDGHCYDAVTKLLTEAGACVIVPWLRGFGATRFLSDATPRSGEQAALAADLVAMLDALGLRAPILAGYDWGGRAACITAALWPERVRGLVSQNSYNIQDIAGAGLPQDPENEYRLWYQYYFHSARGERGLDEHRAAFCRKLWTLWSPDWQFDDATFARTAVSFHNPDFVAVVVHSYRHRFGLVPGDPAVATIEDRLAAQPPITIPAITLDGATDGVMAPGGTAHHARHFTRLHAHRTVAKGGHNLPQEMPGAFADAILDLHRLTGR